MKQRNFKIITIERQYGSGGTQVGKAVAQALGVPFYGREILELAAKAGKTTPEHLEKLEETATNSLLFSLISMGKASLGNLSGLSDEDALNLLEAQIIQEVSRLGSCVIVGRCAGWVLREREDVLRVFLQGSQEFRMERAVSEYGLSPREAPAVLRAFDRRRSNFYRANTGRPWFSCMGYDMVLDSGRIGIENCSRLIVEAVENSR